MHPKKEKKPIADIEKDHANDPDAESSGMDDELPSSEQEVSSDYREKNEQMSADDLWLEAMKRLVIAVRQNSGSQGEGGRSPGSFGSGSLSSPGDEGRNGLNNDSLGSTRASGSVAGGDSGGEADLLEIISRQWRLIGIIVGVAMVVGAVVLWQLTPLYTSNAKLIIEPQSSALPALESILPGVGTDDQSIATEVAILKSGVLLDAVIANLDLVNDPEFNLILGSAENADQVSLEAPTEKMRAVTRGTLWGRLDVTQVGSSRVISVKATSESSDKSALIANSLVDEYFQFRRDSKFQASTETSAWLEERITDLQYELRESEQRAERFRNDADLLEAGGTTLISQQLVNLNSQIISARAATASAQAELTQVGELISSSDSSSILASAGVLQSPLVQELRKQQVALEREIAELSSELGPAHPRMLQLRADAADLEIQMSIEVDKVVQGLRNIVKVSEARQADLEREAALLTSRLGDTKEDEIQLRAFEREVSANQQLLETLLARRKAIGSPDLMETGVPDARVISFATPPISPSFPQIEISLAGIFVVSMIIGFVVAFIREIRRMGISTLEQLEAVTGLTSLGFVPQVETAQQQRSMLVSVITKSKRPFAQAMKTLNWQLDESMPESARVIVVTSPLQAEAKSTTAISLARIKAVKGYKTIIVDADIRNPTVHSKLNCQQTTGLSDVIDGETELEDAIIPDEESPLDILPAGRSSADALGLVESPAMSSILEELSDQYEYVIVDTPPISAAPDACILSKEADTTILAIRCSETPVVAVKYAMRVLRRNGGHITGTILTMVETSRSLSKKYGYFGYYGYYGEKA